jgi:hypothetical protein
MKLLTACSVLLLISLAAVGQTASQPVILPVTFDHNRIIIDVILPQPDGAQKRVRAWVDTGNPDLWVDENVAKRLALEYTSETTGDILGAKVRTAKAPREIIAGGLKIPFAAGTEAKVFAAESIAPGSSAEINLPSSVLRNYDVVVDYVNREMTISLPGGTKFTGKPSKAFMNPANGLLQLTAKLDGEAFNLTLDLGACFSMLAPGEFDAIVKSHKGLAQMTGAVGTALFWGMPNEVSDRYLRLPSLEYGSTSLKGAGFGALPQNFMDFYRKRVGADTAGLVGSNALLNYKVGIDYAHQTVYFDQQSSYEPDGIDVVGLTLRPEWDETYTVIGIPEYEGKPAVPEVKAGDKLVSVDKIPAKGSTMGQIWSLLGGSPGDTRSLVLERGGKQFTVAATVRQFLPAK